MQIKIIVREKIAQTVDKHAFAVCGNSDYTVGFYFDSEWDSCSTCGNATGSSSDW